MLRRELGADVEVIGGPYGHFEVSVDGETVIKGGSLAALGVLPSAEKVLEAVRTYLNRK